MAKKLKYFLFSIPGFFIYFSCIKKETPIRGTFVSFSVPKGFPAPTYDLNNNPVTHDGFALGKKLFYDTRFSSDGNVSCENCHMQTAGFVMPDHDIAHGVLGQHGFRNPLPLQNLAWQKEFMWDGSVGDLDLQPLSHFSKSYEMNISTEEIIQKIKADPLYRQMFKAAFGDFEINTERVLKALSQFMVMLVNGNSKYDRVKNGAAVFDPLENQGYLAFQAKCAVCHAEPLFTDFSYRNIGLPRDAFLIDNGRMRVTHNPQDSLKFKVPSLRNAELTRPYTHDGRFGSLETMIDHYRLGVVNDFSTDVLVRNRISISATEKAALVAFLKTLTDTGFTKNPLFAR
jgi:cytochrome c peroxidase